MDAPTGFIQGKNKSREERGLVGITYSIFHRYIASSMLFIYLRSTVSIIRLCLDFPLLPFSS